MRKLLIITVILLLSGCTTKFAYKNLDWIASWYIGDYIQLTEEQEAIVDQNLAIWLAWHKQEELPRYLADLNALTSDIRHQQLNLEKLTFHVEAIKQHWQRIKDKLVPDLVLLAPLLSDQQVSYLFEKLDEKNAEEREEIETGLALSPERQQNDAIKRYKENLTRWLGKPSPEQETLVIDVYSQLQPNDLLWLEYRKNYQAELKTLFEQSDRGEQFSENLFQLLIEPEVFRSLALNRTNDENALNFKLFLLDVTELTTEKQREKLVNEINKFAEDVDVLMQK
ncbi:MAG: hypothetical protein HN475_01060 [Piscirickettsiaceae bacterium]|nr:hypothetical protein [Piscirickettsiaceae bacterium]